MNKLNFIAAAVLAASSFAASAATSVFDANGVAKFDSDVFAAAGAFSQEVSFSGLGLGSYIINGDISGTKLYFTVGGVTLDGNPFELYTGSNGKLRSGTLLEYTGSAPLKLTVHGVVDGSFKQANYSGSLTVTAVPEPETYALMLAGLGAIGFVARRRKAV